MPPPTVSPRAVSWSATWSSFDQVALGTIHERYPALDVAPDRLPEVGFLPPEAVVGQARAIGARVMQVLHTEISRELVEAHHAADIALWSWTINTDAQIGGRRRSAATA